MPEFVGRLRPPRLAAAPGSPALGEEYYDTGTNSLYSWNGAMWVPLLPPAVTTLPASPVDGQECYFVANATNGVVWRLRYRAASASAFKWEFVGGAPDYLGMPSGTGLTSPSAITAVPGSPTWTVPLAGDYFVDTSMVITLAGAPTGIPAVQFLVGSAAARAQILYCGIGQQFVSVLTRGCFVFSGAAKAAVWSWWWQLAGGAGSWTFGTTQPALWTIVPIRVG